MMNDIKKYVACYDDEFDRLRSNAIEQSGQRPMVTFYTEAEMDFKHFCEDVKRINSQEDYAEYLLDMSMRKFMHVNGIINRLEGGGQV